MATVYEDEQGRFYYEYSQNEVKLKNLANSDPSLYRNVVYPPNKSFSPHNRLQAYDYHLHNEHKYLPIREQTYDLLPTDYGFEGNYIHPNDSAYCNRTKSHSSRNSMRSRSKSSDRRRRRLPLHDNSNLRNGNMPRNRLTNSVQNENVPDQVYEADDYVLPNCYDMNSAVSFTALPARVMQREDLNHGLWLPPQWGTRDSYRSPQALSPASPLDSGLSSQSVASSPSLEAEPIHPRRIHECGSPLPLTAVQKNQCSCSTNSFVESKLLSPQIRSDSGRSSPWAHSALSRLNALTESKPPDLAYSVSPRTDTLALTAHEMDQRRYSMSGIYVNPHERAHSHNLRNCDTEREIYNPLIRNNTYGVSPAFGYEYIDEKLIRTFSPKLNSDSVRGRRSEQLRHLKNNNNKTIEPHCEEYTNGIQEQCEKSPESSVSSPTSNSSTDRSSNKNDSEPLTLRKKSSKNSEKAISELEEMYNKLNLQDYDLLDRAERRDLPTPHQVPFNKPYSLTRSKSDSFYEILGANYCNPFKKTQRAPPMRRSGVPDLIADDMAMRKLQKRTYKQQKANDPIPSYMLYSSHFTPSIPVPHTLLTANRPDIEYDDFSFRRYFQLSSGKPDDPQPPFGIPLHPTPPQSVFSDYMHVVPSGIPPPLCHPRGNPDLVRDDLAFRSLRKDNPERAMFDSYSLFYRKVR